MNTLFQKMRNNRMKALRTSVKKPHRPNMLTLKVLEKMAGDMPPGVERDRVVQEWYEAKNGQTYKRSTKTNRMPDDPLGIYADLRGEYDE